MKRCIVVAYCDGWRAYTLDGELLRDCVEPLEDFKIVLALMGYKEVSPNSATYKEFAAENPHLAPL